jgi:hypothetical protein
VRRDLSLIQLFDPPFSSSPLEPGYVKGYVPGVRENGEPPAVEQLDVVVAHRQDDAKVRVGLGHEKGTFGGTGIVKRSVRQQVLLGLGTDRGQAQAR